MRDRIISLKLPRRSNLCVAAVYLQEGGINSAVGGRADLMVRAAPDGWVE